MTKVINNEASQAEKLANSKEVRSLDRWIKHGGNAEYRSGLTELTDGATMVPEDVVSTAMDLSKNWFNLRKYVDVIPVKTGQGSLPVLSPDAVAHTKRELEEYPDLNAEDQIQTVPFTISTYAGRLSISNELLQDSTVNLIPLLSRDLGVIMTNTTNKAIADKMAEIPAQKITSLDDLINAIETLEPRFQTNIFMDQKSYAKVRTFKDKNGDYLLDGTNNTILGIPVVVLPNYTGVKGVFVGDLSVAMTLFDRMETSLQYQRNGLYGTALCALMRFDVELNQTGSHLDPKTKKPIPEVPYLIHLTFDDDTSNGSSNGGSNSSNSGKSSK